MATYTATATSTVTPIATDTPVPTDTPPPTATATAPPTATPTPPFVTHVVQAGETLSRIASMYGVTVQAIMDANGLSSSIINIGMELTIPTSGSPVSPPPNPTATQSGAAPTATQQAPPPPTPTTPPPTATTQKYQYEYVAGTMQVLEKGCSDLGVDGVIIDSAGRPYTGQVTVRWQLGGYVDYWITNNSPIEEPGVFKFGIYPGPIYHGTKTSTLQLVESEANPSPLSEPLTWEVQDCLDGPEHFANITFRRR